MNTTTPLIQLRSLYKRFGRQVVLNGLDLDIYPGEILAVVGRSGTGKSVLLKHICGLLRPDHGQVIIDGEDMQQARRRQRARMQCRFGMLFQGGALFDSMTVADNVSFPLRETTRCPLRTFTRWYRKCCTAWASPTSMTNTRRN